MGIPMSLHCPWMMNVDDPDVENNQGEKKNMNFELKGNGGGGDKRKGSGKIPTFVENVSNFLIWTI
ncbi:hypothetical protein KY284_000871 [Solanum tuberosum]|nr:hypothetical protein KY284_000871 [Solanum tuberosum]